MPRKKKEVKEEQKRKCLAQLKVDILESRDNLTDAEKTVLRLLKEKHCL